MTKTKTRSHRLLGKASSVTRGPALFGVPEGIGYKPATGISNG
jgi:hypothetical protein